MTNLYFTTRTDARDAVLNSGHCQRFADDASFEQAAKEIWAAAKFNGKDYEISDAAFDAICDRIVG